jgi:hypothetical protein
MARRRYEFRNSAGHFVDSAQIGTRFDPKSDFGPKFHDEQTITVARCVHQHQLAASMIVV